jgi:ribulose 1,5-bisphosphate carboxylase large subunit-like protein
LTVTVDGKTATFNVTVTAKPVPVVKTDLETAIELANAKVEIDYTVDSWSAMQTALTAAQNVDTNASAIQTEVDTAMTGLNTAINGLVSVTPAS